MTFLAIWKNGLIRKLRLVWKFMTLPAGKQAVTIHFLPNNWRSKSNQTVKLDQLTENKMKTIFLQKSCRKSGRKTNSRPLFVFQEKLYMRWKQVVCTLVSIYFGSPWFGNTIKLNCIKFWTVNVETCSTLIFQKRIWD